MKRRSLTAQKIVTAAIGIADENGIDALSMRKVATTLNVTPMSLYNHVDSKDALLDLMLNSVVAEIQTPDVNGPWETMMHRRAHSMRDALLRYRWAAALIMSRITIGDAVIRDHDATIGCLVNNGFTYAQADWARNAIDSHVYGFTIQELNFPVDPEEYQAAATAYLPMIPQDKFPYFHEAAMHIIRGDYDGRTDFDFGLGLVLQGLKTWKDTSAHPR